MATPTTPAAAANAIAEEWSPGFPEAANEERVLTRGFNDGTKGAQKVGKKLWIRKVEAIGGGNVQTLGNASGRADQLTSYVAAPTNVFVLPTYYYVSQEWSPNTLSQLAADSGPLRAAYRRQMLKALATKIDTVGSTQAALLSNFVGGIQAVDQPLLAAAVQSLVVSAKDAFTIGKTMPYLTLINTQVANLIQIPGFVEAHIRGEQGAIKSGWVWDAYNVQIRESGNVNVAAGVAHNIMHTEECEVIAYNEEPHLWEPDRDGIAYIEAATMEFGITELFDEYGVDVRTAG